MSTFQIDKAKFLEWLIPELKWDPLDSARYKRIYEKLQTIDLPEDKILEYLRNRQPRIGFHKQYHSGGGWTFFGSITLTPGDDPLKPYPLSLILHETFHLRQSLLMRLSVKGELLAWQYQKQIYPEIANTRGNAIGTDGEAYCEAGDTSKFWEELSRLSADSREDLERAQAVMRKISSTYRSNALPLYPLHQELWFYLRHGRIRDMIDAIVKLFKAARDSQQ